LILYRDAPTLIHAYGGPGGALIWRRLLLPIVYTAHHTYRQAYTRRHVKRWLGPLEARAYRNAAKVLAVSPSTADAVLAMGVAAARVEVLPSGVEIPATDSAQREPGRLLFVGRLEREKGVLDALTVMQGLAEADPAVHGVVIGVGRLAGHVRQVAANSAGRIDHLGHVDVATLQREYARASVLIMPSRYEGLGMTALEAQAAGTPVLGYDVGGLRDAVTDGGILVPVGDVTALREQTASLLGSPARTAELGHGGRSAMERDHAWDRVAERLMAVYRDVAR